MNRIDRRAMLSMTAAYAAGCAAAPSGDQAAATPKPTGGAQKATAADEAPLVTEVIGRQAGVLIRLEGLIAYSLLVKDGATVEVDALLMRGAAHGHSAGTGNHRHVPTIAIPRNSFHSDILPVAADTTHAYWPLNGKTLRISTQSPKFKYVEFARETPKADQPSDDESWRSTGWVADLQETYQTAYPDRKFGNERNQRSFGIGNPQPAATIKFGPGAEFEPKGITYAQLDWPNGIWELWNDRDKKALVPGRAYKHSLHAFFEGPSIEIAGLLDGATLTVVPGKELVHPVRIFNVPVREQTAKEMEDNKHVKVYGDLIRDLTQGAQPMEISDDMRLYPKFVRAALRHESCGCCQCFRFVRSD